MKALPAGITGFDPTSNGVAADRFSAACYAVARQVGGRVGNVIPCVSRVTPNFHEAIIHLRFNNCAIRVMCNACHPIMAFSSPSTFEGQTQIEFVDCAELEQALGGDFSVLRASEACAPLAESMLEALGDAELRQIRYWRPKRLGDLVFNYWD